LAVVARDFSGPDDLRRMQLLVQASWARRGTASQRHIGDIAWGWHQHVGRQQLWFTRLWLDGEHALAYGWLDENRFLDFYVHPERPELLDEILAWAGASETEALDSDADAIAALERHGFERAADNAGFMVYLARGLDDLPRQALADGFELRTVQEADVGSRVEAHRSAFHPSRVTVESYANVRRAWPYRADLDCIAVAPDGRVAAYCLGWLDTANRVGELEPVGTHADFRRRGLAAAVCSFALHRFAEEGATRAIVYARGDAAYAGPKQLYESIGFRAHTRTAFYRAGASA
jgi:ribosomal protein S18 acetylase RimI-like enzyme